MRRWLCVLTPLIVLLLLVGWRVQQKQAERAEEAAQRAMRSKAAPSVATAVVQVRDLVQTVEVTGNVEAPLHVKIAPKVTGRVEYLEVREGDRVRKGQVLVRIDPSEIEAQVRQQRAAVAEARYRLAQAQLTKNPTEVAVSTQLRQQKAALASATADYHQAKANYEAQLAAANASITDAQGRVESAAAAMANARAAIKSAEANLENAQVRYRRMLELHRRGFVSKQSVDDAQAAVSVQQAQVEIAQGQLKSAMAQHSSALAQKQAAEQQARIVKAKGEADIEAARARLEQTRASTEYAQANQVQKSAYQQSLAALRASVEAALAGLRSAEARRADTLLRSPLDGYVTARYVDPGSVVSAGQPAVAVQYMNEVWISVPVPEEVVAKLRMGQAVKAQLDAYPGRAFVGKITQINPSADPQSRQFTVRVLFENRQNLLKPGMFARVFLETERTPRAVVVPREAVQKERGENYVHVVSPDGKIERRSVRLGPSDAHFIAVLEGVRPGERVVVMASVPLREGMRIRLGGARGPRGEGQRRP